MVKEAVKHKPSEADRAWLDAMYDRDPVPIVEWTDDDVERRFHAVFEAAKVPSQTTGRKKAKTSRGVKKATSHRKLRAGDLPDPPGRPATHLDWEFVFAPYNALVDCLDAYTQSRAFRHLRDPSFSRPPDEP